MSLKEWERDVINRQRNIVFPDTAENEARFWRNVLSGKRPLTVAQKIGLGILLLGASTLVALTFTSYDQGPWRSRLLGTAVDWGFALALLGGFLLLMKWRTGKR